MGQRQASLVIGCLAQAVTACGGATGHQQKTETMRGGIGVFEFGDGTEAWATYGSALADPCETELVGHCQMRRSCDDELTFRGTLDAGGVTVEGVALSRNASASYGAELLRVEPGQTLEMVATGSADVPAHEGSVTVPIPIALTEPATSEPLSVDRSAELLVAWTGGGGSTITSTLFEYMGSARARATCSAPGDAGAMSIPSAVLEKFPSASLRLAVSQDNIETLAAGRWEVALSASHGVLESLEIVLR